jgi:two-component system, cell cycle response regulator
MDEQVGHAHVRYQSLLRAHSLGELFEAMTAGFRAAYGLDAVTLVIRDLHHEVRQLLQAENPHADLPLDVQFTEALEGLAPQYPNLWQVWLGRKVGADHSLVFPGRPGLASCALLPLRRNGDLVGCLNFGSQDPARYTRGDDVEDLQELADIAAVCLENAVNRSRLLRSGITDALTGLYNRRYLQYRLVDELARARREARPLGCIMLDVDHFKPVNSRWGHVAGDHILAQIAHVIRETCRDSDVPIRYGGEEFAVLLPGADLQGAIVTAERVRAAVDRTEFVIAGGHREHLTVSAGVSWVSLEAAGDELKTRGEQLIAEAGVLLCRAKSEGRDRVCGAAA